MQSQCLLVNSLNMIEQNCYKSLNRQVSQPQLNSTVGFDKKKMTLHHPQPPTPSPGTQRLQYLSCYWPNFDQTWNLGFWDQQQHEHEQQQQQTTKLKQK